MVAHFFLYVGLFLKPNPMTIVDIFFPFHYCIFKEIPRINDIYWSYMPISFCLNHGYNFLMLQIRLHGFPNWSHFICLIIKALCFFSPFFSSWSFLNVRLHELKYRFWLLECMCNVDGLQFVMFINQFLFNVVCMHIGIFVESIKGG